MIYLRDEGGLIRNGFNFYPLKSVHIGFQFMLGRLRIELRRNKLLKRNAFRVWLKKPTKDTKEEFIYIPGYTEFLEKCARKRFGNSPWLGVEPEDKFKSEGVEL